jgi:hypothetical protein
MKKVAYAAQSLAVTQEAEAGRSQVLFTWQFYFGGGGTET